MASLVRDMSKGKAIWSALLVIAITAVIVSTAYLAAGALYERFLPEEEGPAAKVTLIAVATGGLDGMPERSHVPTTWATDEVYDLGVWVVGLRSESGVLVKFSLSRPDISSEDVNVMYYDPDTDSWRSLVLHDKGDVLEGTLGLSGGIAMYEGYDQLHRLLIYSHIDGACQVRAWFEIE